MSLLDRFRNDRTFASGQRALDRGDLAEAIRIFEEYVRADDRNPSAWFNLGLAYKLARDWPNAVRCNRRSAELDPSSQEAHWNMGVAATAIRDWATARAAWRGIGLDPPPGADPPEFQDLGMTPVRLNAGDGEGTETVWGTRVDPCRVRIESVPLPESGHRWGDIVLHDVVPNGTRQVGDRTWSVFDELMRMDPSDAPTFESRVTVPTQEDGTALTELLAGLDVGVEDWSESVQMICAQCDVSSSHQHAANDVNPMRLIVRRYGFGGDAAAIGDALERWVAAGTGREFEPLTQVA